MFALAAVAMASIPEGMEPPIISMKLDNVNGDLRKGDTDKNGIPCLSHGADKVSCHQLKDTPHQTHYAFCYVDNADETNCPEPTVEVCPPCTAFAQVCLSSSSCFFVSASVALSIATSLCTSMSAFFEADRAASGRQRLPLRPSRMNVSVT